MTKTMTAKTMDTAKDGDDQDIRDEDRDGDAEVVDSEDDRRRRGGGDEIQTTSH